MPDVQENSVQGTTGMVAMTSNIYRCGHCYRELFEADNGYGGTRLACPKHGWNRYPVLTIPSWIEDWVEDHPLEAIAYITHVADKRARCEACEVPVPEDSPTHGPDSIYLCHQCLSGMEGDIADG